MVFDSDLGRVASQRKRTVGQIAKFWGQQQLLEDTPRIEADKPGLTGHQLIVRLQASSKELQGRVVGRNKDDALFICKGLEVLAREWEALQGSVQQTQECPLQAEHVSPSTDGRTTTCSPLSESSSADTALIRRQQQAIQQLEDRECRLQDELRQLKCKWEAIMAKTMEQQAAIHREQLKQQEALLAEKMAEMERLKPLLHDRPAQPLPSKPVRKNSQYVLAGSLTVGQTLQILGPCDEDAPDKLQWYRVISADKWQLISGATRNQYSPEPLDAGYALACCIHSHGSSPSSVARVASKAPVSHAPGLEDWVDRLAEQGAAHFSVVVVQRNGMLHTNREVCSLEVTLAHIALRLPSAITLQQAYNPAMQVCGARGAGDAAAQGLFLAFRVHEVFMLACETAHDRNACIMLIRKMAALHGLHLTGPEEPASAKF